MIKQFGNLGLAVVVCCCAGVVRAGQYEKTLNGVTAGLVKLSCKEPGGWSFSMACEKAPDGVEILRVKLRSDKPAVPPRFDVEVRFPAVDVPHLWKPEYNYHGVRPNWTSGDCRPSETSYAWWTPVYCLHNATDRNRFAFATSECVRPVLFRPCITEETLCAFLRFSYFREPEAPMAEYETSVRMDRRDVFYADAIRDASNWILAERKERPCVSPREAFKPIYSSWYSFHQNVFDKDIEAECAEAAKLGMKVLIVDDGWQTDDTGRGYAFCGDWEISKRRFPDMRAHVAKVHALGMKYMVWFSMPSIGVKSANYRRFKGKYLRVEPGREATLDPRFPEVRDFLADVYERALREWDIDGFKLDFVNSFCLLGEADPAVAENYAGRDIRSVHEAIDRLVSDVTRRLKAIKPDLLVEFRQTYMGPALRKYGNMFRVADCCGVFAANRAGIAALRLTSGDNAVHSDMIAWHPSETPEQASRQILNSIFGTIQYSMMLRTMPEDHKRMVQHWIRFSSDHEDALQHGAFRPYHPEHQYPVVEGESAAERIIGVYTDTMVADCGTTNKTVYVLNATGSGRVFLNLSSVPAAVRAFDTFGNPAPAPALVAGLNSAAVPEGGYLVFTSDSTSVLAETARWQTAIDRMAAAGGGIVDVVMPKSDLCEVTYEDCTIDSNFQCTPVEFYGIVNDRTTSRGVYKMVRCRIVDNDLADKNGVAVYADKRAEVSLVDCKIDGKVSAPALKRK